MYTHIVFLLLNEFTSVIACPIKLLPLFIILISYLRSLNYGTPLNDFISVFYSASENASSKTWTQKHAHTHTHTRTGADPEGGGQGVMPPPQTVGL